MKVPRVQVATKTSGHAKGFPPSPLPRGTPPTPPFQKLRNAIEPLSGGIRGQTFCSTLQLSRSFKMLSWFYSGGFSGTIFVCENCLLAQWLVSHRTRQQGGVVTPPESFAHRTRRCTHSLWRKKKIRKQNLRHIFRRCVSRKI